MFETLSERITDTFRNLAGRGRISQDNVREAMDEVRTALLEADVHLQVVTQFCEEVAKDAIERASKAHGLGLSCEVAGGGRDHSDSKNSVRSAMLSALTSWP